MGKPEASIESYLVKRAKLVGAEIRKSAWIGRRGCPDRFVMTMSGAPNFWAECKRPGGKLEDHQEREIGLMLEHGELVYVFDSREQIDVALPFPR